MVIGLTSSFIIFITIFRTKPYFRHIHHDFSNFSCYINLNHYQLTPVTTLDPQRPISTPFSTLLAPGVPHWSPLEPLLNSLGQPFFRLPSFSPFKYDMYRLGYRLCGQNWGNLTVQAIKIRKPVLCPLWHKYSFLKVSPHFAI